MQAKAKERSGVALRFLDESIVLAGELVNVKYPEGFSPSQGSMIARIVSGSEMGRAIKRLLDVGHWMPAAVILRSLVESFISAGWIGMSDERANLIDSGHERRIRVLHSQLREQGYEVPQDLPVVDRSAVSGKVPSIEQMALDADKDDWVDRPIFKETYDWMYRLYSGWVHGYKSFLGPFDDDDMVFLIARDSAGILNHLMTLTCIVLDLPAATQNKIKGLHDRLVEFERVRDREVAGLE